MVTIIHSRTFTKFEKLDVWKCRIHLDPNFAYLCTGEIRKEGFGKFGEKIRDIGSF